MANTVSGTKGFVLVSLEERFWSKVDKSGECWLWTGSLSGAYGRIWDRGKNRPTAQVAWELENGEPFPEGMFACHHCDNPPCVRPSHIFVGTRQNNVDDAVQKGRFWGSPGLKPRTHCHRGHEMSGDNLHFRSGRRECAKCRRMQQEARRIRDRARRAALAEPGSDVPL